MNKNYIFFLIDNARTITWTLYTIPFYPVSLRFSFYSVDVYYSGWILFTGQNRLLMT